MKIEFTAVTEQNADGARPCKGREKAMKMFLYDKVFKPGLVEPRRIHRQRGTGSRQTRPEHGMMVENNSGAERRCHPAMP